MVLAKLSSLDVTLADSIRKYSSSAKASETKRGYSNDLADFARFCTARNLIVLPASPTTVAGYLSWLADRGRRPATIARRMAAISKAHAAAGYPSPSSLREAIVAETWAGIKRTVGIAQVTKSAATVDYLKAMLAHTPDSLIGARDRALLLVGFAGAFRRSELVSLAVEDLAFVPEGIVLLLRSSKTDQEAAGQKVAITLGQHPETCPVRSLRTWLDLSGITTGPIFRSISRWGYLSALGLTSQVVALVVKRYALAAGLDPAVFAGHSLRSGLATAAAIAGAEERNIMAQTRHKSPAMVRRYIRDTNLFRHNVSGLLGL